MNRLLNLIAACKRRPLPQICRYSNDHLETLQFSSRRSANRYLKKILPNARKQYGWTKSNIRSGYDRIIYMVEKGDHLHQQNKPIYAYKQSENGALLALSPEDLAHIKAALYLHNQVGAFNHIFIGWQQREEEKLVQALTQLKNTCAYISAMDSGTIQMIDALEFISTMTHFIAKRCRHTYYANALSAISLFLTNQASLEATIQEMESLSSYSRESVLLDASNETFALHLNAYDCFMKRTGKCSLLLNQDELAMYAQEKIDSKDKTSVHYCWDMLQLMQTKGTPKIEAARNIACGHISITNGQHRSCISKTLNMPLPAKLTTYESYCSHCSRQRDNREMDYYYLK